MFKNLKIFTIGFVVLLSVLLISNSYVVEAVEDQNDPVIDTKAGAESKLSKEPAAPHIGTFADDKSGDANTDAEAEADADAGRDALAAKAKVNDKSVTGGENKADKVAADLLSEASAVKRVGTVEFDDNSESDVVVIVNTGWLHAFWASLTFIIVSELGDKTFFIAAIMAMRQSRLTVFIGACSALVVMTVLSAGMGYAFTIIPRLYTHYASTVLFFIFGFRLLKEGYEMAPDEGQEEMEEVSIELKRKEDELDQLKRGGGDLESGDGESTFSAISVACSKMFNPVMLQAFTMTFLAEWGDRSQITTVVLATRENPYGIAVGGSIGHCMCTGLAVIGGRMLAQKISVRTVTIVGGLTFLGFAILSLYQDPSGE
eukprot:Nk52_evm23s96 gene=Nk52_evmTU23s96